MTSLFLNVQKSDWNNHKFKYHNCDWFLLWSFIVFWTFVVFMTERTWYAHDFFNLVWLEWIWKELPSGGEFSV